MTTDLSPHRRSPLDTPDHSGVRDPRPLGAIGSMRMGDIGRGLARYRAVAGVALAIIIAAAVLPGPDTEEGDRRFAAPAAPVGQTTDELGTGEAPAPESPAVDSGSSDFEFTPLAPSPERSFSSPSFSSPSPSSGSNGSSSGSTFTSPTTTTTVVRVPLRVRAAAWSTTTAGTPLASEGVPDSSLPVGMRFGQADKVSYVRLAGTADVLRLKLADEAGQRSPDAAQVMVCPITSEPGWSEGEALAHDEAPTYDCASGVLGQAGEGEWTFAFSSFPDPDNDRGFALVPVGDGLADFQVAFSPRG